MREIVDQRFRDAVAEVLSRGVSTAVDEGNDSDGIRSWGTSEQSQTQPGHGGYRDRDQTCDFPLGLKTRLNLLNKARLERRSRLLQDSGRTVTVDKRH